MLGDILSGVINKQPNLFINIEKKLITYLLKELIIMEIICLEGQKVTSKEIQDIYEDKISRIGIPEEFLEESKSAKGKSNLKVSLNNILSSNLKHQNGLMNRKEIEVTKNGITYQFSASKEILNDISQMFHTEDDVVDIFKMADYYEKYKYIPLLLKLMNLKTNYCQHNSNHIERKTIFPVFKNIDDGKRSSILNVVFVCDKCVVDMAESALYKFEERGY